MLFTIGRVAARSSFPASRWTIARPLPRVRFATKPTAIRAFTQSYSLNEAVAEPKAKRATKTTAKKSTKSATKKAAAKKPVKNAKKTKAKPKPKLKKVVKKPPSKTALELLARQNRKQLLETALLNEPKQLPTSPYNLYVVKHFAEHKPANLQEATGTMGDAAAAYKHLSHSEKANLETTARANRAANEAAYLQWVASHTPVEIRAANVARAKLRRELKAADKKVPRKYQAIQDDRIPKKPASSFLLFFNQRQASGSYGELSTGQAAKEASKEFKSLSESERKAYDDQAAALRSSYSADYAELFKAEV